jgi:hypothetical protein
VHGCTTPADAVQAPESSGAMDLGVARLGSLGSPVSSSLPVDWGRWRAAWRGR